MKVGIVITTYRAPHRLDRLLDNMKWAGIPDIPLHVFVDPPMQPDMFSEREHYEYLEVCSNHKVPMYIAPKWGCMHGIIDFALQTTVEDWIIYVPDDVLFTMGGLMAEYANVLAYGKEWVGAIQLPYWDAKDLVDKSVIPHRAIMVNREWQPRNIPRNPHWENNGIPRAYINVNGAGFAISRDLYKKMGGWPKETWRLDEYAGWSAWRLGKCVITVPGPPRVHFGGAAAGTLPDLGFDTEDAWFRATGTTIAGADRETRRIMDRTGGQSANWKDLVAHFSTQHALIG